MDYYGDPSGGPHQHHQGAYNWATSAPQYDAYGHAAGPHGSPYGLPPPEVGGAPPGAVAISGGGLQAIHPVVSDGMGEAIMQPEEPVTLLNPQEIQADCLAKFARSDYIMEPGIFNQLKRYFQSGGNPEQVIDLLSSNYCAYAQMANLMAEWIISAGNI